MNWILYLTDITFTITDLSSFGAISFTPLINKNNSAILGVSKIDEKLKVDPTSALFGELKALLGPSAVA